MKKKNSVICRSPPHAVLAAIATAGGGGITFLPVRGIFASLVVGKKQETSDFTFKEAKGL